MCGANAEWETERGRGSDHPRVCGANVLIGFVAHSSVRIIPACAGRTRNAPNRITPTSDHPRVCGANTNRMSPWSRRVGSSPRVRGELIDCVVRASPGRIIPACAGRTRKSNTLTASSKDHPRVCGANVIIAVFMSSFPGSSPRVRGERRQRAGCNAGAWIIPACAGRTRSSDAARGRAPDHPRVCGANNSLNTVQRKQFGSSPRVRGEPGVVVRAVW